MTAWATEQARLLVTSQADTDMHARAVLDLGGDPGDLRLARTSEGLLSTSELRDWAAGRDTVAVLDVEHEINEARDYYFIPPNITATLAAEVIDVRADAVRTSTSPLLRGSERRTLHGLLRLTLAAAWGCNANEIEVNELQSSTLVSAPEADEFEVRAERWLRPQPRLPGM